MWYNDRQMSGRIGSYGMDCVSIDVKGASMKGIIIKGVGGLYTVLAEDGKRYFCRARGHFRHAEITPTVGDRVQILIHDESEKRKEGGCTIESIDERKNLLIRPPVSNIDILFAVVAAKSPEPNLLNLDKLLCIAEHNGIEPAVIISKSDLDGGKAEELAAIYRQSGFDTCIKKDGDCEETKTFVFDRIEGKTAVFSGASGVGKSTLINMLFPQLRIETGSVSEKNERGRHTTRHVELFPLEELTEGKLSGFVADTPGFSMLDFLRFDFFTKDELPYTFREFVPLLPFCRYNGCTHTGDEDCAVLTAFEEGKIPPSRYESYKYLYQELKSKPTWKK